MSASAAPVERITQERPRHVTSRIDTSSSEPITSPVAARRWVLARRISLMVAALIAVSSVCGLVVDGLYRDPAGLREMFRGYDLVSLVIVAPAVVVGAAAARRGNVVGQLVWLGGLTFAVYNYALYVFASSFNDLFLLHVTVFALSGVALAVGLASIDADAVAARFRSRTPVRWVAGVLVVLAAGLGAMWVSYSLRFAFTGETPAESELVVPIATTHLAYVLDLSLLVPVYVAAGVLLWRCRPWGFVLAGAVLLSGVVHQISYMTALVFQTRAGVAGATAFDAGEPPVVALYLVATALLLGGLAGESPVRR